VKQDLAQEGEGKENTNIIRFRSLDFEYNYVETVVTVTILLQADKQIVPATTQVKYTILTYSTGAD
jgi:hypothetical protein